MILNQTSGLLSIELISLEPRHFLHLALENPNNTVVSSPMKNSWLRNLCSIATSGPTGCLSVTLWHRFLLSFVSINEIPVIKLHLVYFKPTCKPRYSLSRLCMTLWFGNSIYLCLYTYYYRGRMTAYLHWFLIRMKHHLITAR